MVLGFKHLYPGISNSFVAKQGIGLTYMLYFSLIEQA